MKPQEERAIDILNVLIDNLSFSIQIGTPPDEDFLRSLRDSLAKVRELIVLESEP